MPSRLNTPAAEESLSHGLHRGVWSEFQLGAAQAFFDGRLAEEAVEPSGQARVEEDLRAVDTDVVVDVDVNVVMDTDVDVIVDIDVAWLGWRKAYWQPRAGTGGCRESARGRASGE